MITLIILGVTVLLFVSDWLRLDLVALLMLLALMLTQIISPEQALAGFSDPVVVMIAALFVVSGAIINTGTAQALGRLVSKLTGSHESSLILALMLGVALLSAFMSSTGSAAVFLPIALSLAREAHLSPSRLLMPMAFASFLGGMLTLIGTPPNLVVSNLLKAAGLPGFQFFDFTLPGLIALVAAIAYMLLVGRHLLPGGKTPVVARKQQPSANELLAYHQLTERLNWLRLPHRSPLFEKSLLDLQFNKTYGLQLLCTHDHQGSGRKSFVFCRAQTRLQADQDILVFGAPEQAEAFTQLTGAVFVKAADQEMIKHLGLAEILILPRAKLLGQSLKEFRFRERYNLHVLSIQRHGKLLIDSLSDIPLRFGDYLLVQGPWKRIYRLHLERRDFTVLNLPAEVDHYNHPPYKIALTLAWLAFMLLLLLSGWLPTVLAILITAVGLVVSRCLSMEEAYRSISWESVILIAAMLPMATALENTGGTALLSQWLGHNLGGLGAYGLMAALFVLTSGCSLFLSNTATTVLIAPVALQLALQLDYQPRTFLMVVALAASSAFSTPISSPVNTMVLSPGAYRFSDYLKVGLPLQILMMVITLLIVPILFGL